MKYCMHQYASFAHYAAKLKFDKQTVRRHRLGFWSVACVLRYYLKHDRCECVRVYLKREQLRNDNYSASVGIQTRNHCAAHHRRHTAAVVVHNRYARTRVAVVYFYHYLSSRLVMKTDRDRLSKRGAYRRAEDLKRPWSNARQQYCTYGYEVRRLRLAELAGATETARPVVAERIDRKIRRTKVKHAHSVSGTARGEGNRGSCPGPRALNHN
jgi:hypothetical protein